MLRTMCSMGLEYHVIITLRLEYVTTGYPMLCSIKKIFTKWFLVVCDASVGFSHNSVLEIYVIKKRAKPA